MSIDDDGLAEASILWRRLDRPGRDFARLTERAIGPSLKGTAEFDNDSTPCRLDHGIVCDPLPHGSTFRV